MTAISLIDFANQAEDARRSALVQKITNESIFLRILRFVTVDGFAYHYSEQATTGGIAFRAINEDYTPDTGVVNPKVESLAIFGGEVKTDRQIVNKQGDVARANSIMGKVKRAGLHYDYNVINGDPATGDIKGFYGIKNRLAGNQLITAGTNGAALTLAMVDDLLDRVVGKNEQKVLVMNKFARRKIKQLAVAAAGGAAVTDVGGSLKSYDGCPIEEIDEDGDDNPVITNTETTGTSSVTTSIYCIRPGQDVEGEFVQGLIGSQLIEHVQVGLQGTYYRDLVEANMGLAVFHGRSAARLKGILTA